MHEPNAALGEVLATPTIATLRHMKGVGIFSDFAPAAAVKFNKMNLIYAFNGTGKTTLSRLFEALRNDQPVANLPEGADFSFGLEGNTVVSCGNLASPAARFIAVFNEDYIESSLTWKDGSAKPIVYLGPEQAGLVRELAQCEEAQKTLASEETLRSSEWSAAHRAAETKARDIARLIALEVNLGRKYTAANLNADYAAEEYDPSNKIQESEVKTLKELIYKTEVPVEIDRLPNIPDIAQLKRDISAVLSTEVSAAAVESLQRRQDAYPWVARGVELHEHESECLFCGNAIFPQRMEELKIALSGGYKELSKKVVSAETSTNDFIARSQAFRQAIAGLEAAALPQFRDDVRAAQTALASWLLGAERTANRWLGELATKRERADTAYFPSEAGGGLVESDGPKLHAALSAAVSLHNAEVSNFAKSQKSAQNKLKRHILADNQSSLKDLQAKASSTKAAYGGATAKLQECQSKIAEILSQMRTHGPAAAKLNKLLESYLGHSQIKLGVSEQGYVICRGGKPSKKPLSEGERTAVAFCYFLTNLNSEGRKLKDLIVVIDDPISSLDTRAMTHVVSLVRKNLADVSQLFILTHNLDFMREMKKWLNKKREKGEAAFLYIETRLKNGNERSSKIVEMPKLIREYESEYHYLFSLVKILSDSPNEAELFAYLMPNAIRKVLDIFLAFKVPGSMGLEAKVDKLLKDFPELDPARVKSMERLAQIESHAESIGDVTTFSAYTLEQVSDAASCLLEMIASADPAHSVAMRDLCRP